MSRRLGGSRGQRALLCYMLVTLPGLAQQPSTHVDAAHVSGPRPLAEQTRTAAVRDYLQAWKAMDAALGSGEAGPLEGVFVGGAHDGLAETIVAERGLGLRTRYQDRSHQVRILFYSPEGLSIELVDDVVYDVEVLDTKGKVISTSPQTARYVAVLTPSEVRWQVRTFEAVAPAAR